MGKSKGIGDWWWVLCFCLGAAFLYFHCIQEKRAKLADVSLRLDSLREEKVQAIQEREMLRLQINSQSDPSWIEMILMRDFGMVPEGWLKVHFALSSS